MDIQNGAHAPTPKACPNLARRCLFAVAPVAADLALLFGLGVLLWIA